MSYNLIRSWEVKGFDRQKYLIKKLRLKLPKKYYNYSKDAVILTKKLKFSQL